MGRSPKFTSKRQERFPWVLLLVFVLTIYLFWIMPLQMGSRPVDVQFSKAK